MSYIVTNITKKVVLAEKAELADRFFSRMKGLLGRSCLKASAGLIIRPAGSLHTWFMAFTIDIIFLDKKGQILKACGNVSPFKFIPCPLRTTTAIELPAQTLTAAQTHPGDIIEIR